MNEQRQLFKDMQKTICMQSPATTIILEMCDAIAAVFAEGLKACEHELSFKAVSIPTFPNDPEGLRMASEVDTFRTGVANCIKYDYTDLADLFDYDSTTEKVEGATELWLHARRKLQ